MKAPENLYVVVCDEWTGSRYVRSNVGIYSAQDTASMAAQSMQGNYKTSDIEYWVDELTRKVEQVLTEKVSYV